MPIVGKSVTDRTPVVIRNAGWKDIRVMPIQNLFSFEERRMGQLVEKELNRLEIWTSQGWKILKRVMRHRQDEKPVMVITPGGIIELTCDHSLYSNNFPIQVRDIKPGLMIDLIDVPELSFVHSVDPELAWFYGLFIGNGTYSWSRGSIHIVSKDEKIIKKAIQIAKKYGYSISNWRETQDKTVLYNCEIFQVAFFSKFYVSECQEVKEKKSKWKVIPPFIFAWKKESLEHLFEGIKAGNLIRSEETCPKGSFSFSSISQSMAQGIYILYRNLYCKSDMTFTYLDDFYIMKSFDEKNSKKQDNEIVSINEAGSLQRDEVNEKGEVIENPSLTTKENWNYSTSRWVYDCETETQDFLAGLGKIRAHNSSNVNAQKGGNAYRLNLFTIEKNSDMMKSKVYSNKNLSEDRTKIHKT